MSCIQIIYFVQTLFCFENDFRTHRTVLSLKRSPCRVTETSWFNQHHNFPIISGQAFSGKYQKSTELQRLFHNDPGGLSVFVGKQKLLFIWNHCDFGRCSSVSLNIIWDGLELAKAFCSQPRRLAAKTSRGPCRAGVPWISVRCMVWQATQLRAYVLVPGRDSERPQFKSWLGWVFLTSDVWLFPTVKGKWVASERLELKWELHELMLGKP